FRTKEFEHLAQQCRGFDGQSPYHYSAHTQADHFLHPMQTAQAAAKLDWNSYLANYFSQRRAVARVRFRESAVEIDYVKHLGAVSLEGAGHAHRIIIINPGRVS